MAFPQAIDKMVLLDVNPDPREIDWHSLKDEVATYTAGCSASELFP